MNATEGSATESAEPDYRRAPYLCQTDSTWGRGFTVDEAKANAKRQPGGSLTRYIVYRMPEHAEGAVVDDFGRVQWRWTDGYDGPMQVELEVVAKRGVKVA